MTNILLTPNDVAKQIAQSARKKRLSLNFSQKSLSEKSGVSFSTIKKFELTGKISLESLLKIAFSLESINPFLELFKLSSPEEYPSLEAFINKKSRKRGRK